MRWTHKTKEELVTEIRHLKKELRVLEVNERSNGTRLSVAEELQKTVENLNLVGIVIEEDGVIIFCNIFASKMLGYEFGALVGQNFFEVLVPTEERTSRFTAFQEAMVKGRLKCCLRIQTLDEQTSHQRVTLTLSSRITKNLLLLTASLLF